MREFVIFSLKWSRGDFAVFWGPNDSGYTTNVDQAGRYPEDKILANPNYYNNGDSTLAIPLENIIKISFPAVLNNYGELSRLAMKTDVKVQPSGSAHD